METGKRALGKWPQYYKKSGWFVLNGGGGGRVSRIAFMVK